MVFRNKSFPTHRAQLIEPGQDQNGQLALLAGNEVKIARQYDKGIAQRRQQCGLRGRRNAPFLSCAPLLCQRF